MGGLTQRFQANRGECGLDGVGVTAGCAQFPGKALQRVQPGLAQPFSLVLQPVVIPVRQEIADQVGQVHRIQVNGLGRGSRLGEPARECDQITHINLDVGVEPEKRWGGGDHLLAGLVDPPQRGTQVGE